LHLSGQAGWLLASRKRARENFRIGGNMGDNNDLTPAIIFVESPHAVCTLDRAIFEPYHHKKIILVEEDAPSQPFFSPNDLILPTSFMDRSKLDQSYRWIASRYRVEAVLGFSETSVFAAAYLADKFRVEGIGTDAALRCRDKSRMAAILRQGGVQTPAYFLATPQTPLAEQVEAMGGYPVICKPLMGFASCGVVRADNEDALRRAIRNIRLQNKFMLDRYYEPDETAKQVMVQKFIAGEEVAIDGYVHKGKAHTVAIIDKPDVSQGPYFDDRMHVLPSRLDMELQAALTSVTEASVAAIGLDNSPFHLEARIADGEIYVLEIGARIGFMRSVQDATGIDLCATMVAMKMGQTPDARSRRHAFAGNLCVTSHKVGKFNQISNMDSVTADPHIVDIPLMVSRGDRVAAPPDANAYIAYILSAADSYEAVEHALRRAAAKLNVVID
jgi:biotin carboxylase